MSGRKQKIEENKPEVEKYRKNGLTKIVLQKE